MAKRASAAICKSIPLSDFIENILGGRYGAKQRNSDESIKCRACPLDPSESWKSIFERILVTLGPALSMMPDIYCGSPGIFQSINQYFVSNMY